MTVNRPTEELATEDELALPLLPVTDMADVELRLAPGGRGTEVRATLRPQAAGGITARPLTRVAAGLPDQRLREALRQARQLLETGEVLRVEQQPSVRGGLTGLVTDVMDRWMRRGGRP